MAWENLSAEIAEEFDQRVDERIVELLAIGVCRRQAAGAASDAERNSDSVRVLQVREYSAGWKARNPDRVRDYRAEWRARNPGKDAEYNSRRTPEQRARNLAQRRAKRAAEKAARAGVVCSGA